MAPIKKVPALLDRYFVDRLSRVEGKVLFADHVSHQSPQLLFSDAIIERKRRLPPAMYVDSIHRRVDEGSF